MDDEQVFELRSWAQRLAADDRADVRAAGKAIVMLADELTVLRARQGLESDVAAATAGPATTTPAPEPASSDVASSLRTRLRSLVGVREEEPRPEPADERGGSPRADG
jgi:hypothetical protein